MSERIRRTGAFVAGSEIQGGTPIDMPPSRGDGPTERDSGTRRKNTSANPAEAKGMLLEAIAEPTAPSGRHYSSEVTRSGDGEPRAGIGTDGPALLPHAGS